ncbi:uncharacterized protein [Haliotis cracherodii]|uniref:uncharacterized protein isoform X1 n=1 Tax=Haliotis cracherodii TaxID=6455 RepID=UPI0039EAE0B0
MKLIGHCVGLLLLGITSCQIWIPKRELGFVYNRGRADAPVRVDAFLDLLCPDSKRAYGVIRQVAENYGPSVLQLRVHIFPLPYHKNAFDAGKGAFAVDRLTEGNKTYEWFNNVFDHMGSFSNSFTHGETGTKVFSDLSSLAQTLGINKNDFKELMTSNTELELDARLAWKYGCTRAIHSTPMVMINDILVNTNHPESLSFEQWKTIIDPLLKRRPKAGIKIIRLHKEN